MGIAASITEMKGRAFVSGAVRGDDVCAVRLIEYDLEKLASSHDGWDALYIDPSDGRLWELTYPDSHLHGGGPPALTIMSQRQAAKKYGGGGAI